MSIEKNKKILEFLDIIETNDVYYATESDKSFLRMYDACDDFTISKNNIKSVWNYLISQFLSLQSLKSTVNPISILHTNA